MLGLLYVLTLLSGFATFGAGASERAEGRLRIVHRTLAVLTLAWAVVTAALLAAACLSAVALLGLLAARTAHAGRGTLLLALHVLAALGSLLALAYAAG